MKAPSLLAIFGLPAIACAAWTIYAGKDVNWDLLHYHYYLPYQLLGGRIEQDFFAASSQSYLNPLGYLPFYWMVSGGWHSVAVSVVLAAAHGTSLGLLFLLAWRAFAHLPARERPQFSVLATALGAATAIYWMTVGTSFLDPLLVPLMLGGLLLLAQPGESRPLQAAFAGALFGLAAALKYSNVIFVVAALPLAFAGASVAQRLRCAVAYSTGAALAIAVVAGPWLALMVREFGNPVFPVMNAWFQAPEGLPVNLVSERFTAKDLFALAAFPFRAAALDRSLYAENFAPDLRFAAVVLAALGAAGSAWTRRSAAAGGLGGVDWRLFVFVGLGYVLWLLTSANGRYGMVLLLLIGVCAARLTERLLPLAIARATLVVLLLVQAAATMLASPSRWYIAEPWSRDWLPFDVPARARNEPALYVSLEVLSMSAIAPFLHRESAFVNFRGQYSLRPDSPRLAALLEKHRGRVRTLGRGAELSDAGQVRAYDATLVRIGYRVDAGDCYTIEWAPQEGGFLSRVANRLTGELPWHEPLSAVSCALVPAERDPAQAREERRFSALFDQVERACPKLLRGQTAVTEPLGSGWSRNYGGLDARLEALGGRIVLNRHRSATYVDLGPVSDWERGVVAGECRER